MIYFHIILLLLLLLLFVWLAAVEIFGCESGECSKNRLTAFYIDIILKKYCLFIEKIKHLIQKHSFLKNVEQYCHLYLV